MWGRGMHSVQGIAAANAATAASTSTTYTDTASTGTGTATGAVPVHQRDMRLGEHWCEQG